VLAAVVDNEHHPDHRTAARAARALWEHRLLPVLAGFSGTEELTAIDHRWQGLVTSWNRQAEWLRSQLPPSAKRPSRRGRGRPGRAPGRAGNAARTRRKPRPYARITGCGGRSCPQLGTRSGPLVRLALRPSGRRPAPVVRADPNGPGRGAGG